MERLKSIEKEVKKFYNEAKDASLREWFFEGHVLYVADKGREIAKETEASEEIVVLAALFHDLARTWGVWEDPQMMEETLEKAQQIMRSHDYSDDQFEEVKLAIVNHGCKGDLPSTLEGKVLSTADSLAHLMTDFYFILPFYGWLIETDDYGEFKKWVVSKNEKEFHKKIFFEKYKELARPRYDAFKILFS